MPKPKSALKAKSASRVLPGHEAGATGIGAAAGPALEDVSGTLQALGPEAAGSDSGSSGAVTRAAKAAQTARASAAEAEEQDESEESQPESDEPNEGADPEPAEPVREADPDKQVADIIGVPTEGETV